MTAFLVLAFGCALMGASWWLRPVSEAEQAMTKGDAKGALALYEVARARFDSFPVTKRMLPGVYDLVTANELALLYSLQRYDDIIEKSSVDGGGETAPFWAACAMFDKALLEEKPEARMGWVSQSHQQFRRALDLTASDWDTKFNYELTGRLMGGMKKQPDTTKQEMMKLLRDAPKSQQQPVRRVG